MKKYTIKYCFNGSFIEVECDEFDLIKIYTNESISQAPVVTDNILNEKSFSIDINKVIAWHIKENSYYPDSYEEKWKMAKEIIDEIEKYFGKEYHKTGNYEEPLGMEESHEDIKEKKDRLLKKLNESDNLRWAYEQTIELNDLKNWETDSLKMFENILQTERCKRDYGKP